MDDNEKLAEAKRVAKEIELKDKERRKNNIKTGLTYGIPAAAIIGLGTWVAVERSNKNDYAEQLEDVKQELSDYRKSSIKKYNALVHKHNDLVNRYNPLLEENKNVVIQRDFYKQRFIVNNLKYDKTIAERDSLSGVVADVTSDNDSLIIANSGLEKSLSEVRDSLSSEQKLSAEIKEALENLQMSKEQMYEALLNSNAWGAAIIKNRTFGYINQKEVNKMKALFEEYKPEELKNFNFPTTFRERRNEMNYIRNQLPN